MKGSELKPHARTLIRASSSDRMVWWCIRSALLGVTRFAPSFRLLMWCAMLSMSRVRPMDLPQLLLQMIQLVEAVE